MGKQTHQEWLDGENENKTHWFDELNEIDQRTIMAIKREVVTEVGEPSEYDCVMDFFFDIHETYKFCFFK